MKRRLAREYALKALVMVELGSNNPEHALFYLFNDNELSEKESSFCHKLMMGTLKEQQEIDEILLKYLLNWDLDRLSTVVRNILRLGAFEILYSQDIPVSVTINEYIELSKLYQDEESAGFVNGILDNIKNETEKV